MTEDPGAIRRRWFGYDTRAKVWVLAQAFFYIACATAAFRDLRSRSHVWGLKVLWAVEIPSSIAHLGRQKAWVFPLGAVAYSTVGRRP